jgi:hypothetical protein
LCDYPVHHVQKFFAPRLLFAALIFEIRECFLASHRFRLDSAGVFSLVYYLSPFQKYIDRGYFRLIEQRYQTPDGETHVSLKLLAYQTGIDFIRRKLVSYDRSDRLGPVSPTFVGGVSIPTEVL